MSDTPTGEFVEYYISADIETDGPIPGLYSMLSFALVGVGSFDGSRFVRDHDSEPFYREVRPISNRFQEEALSVNGLDRDLLMTSGTAPTVAMDDAFEWVQKVAEGRHPVLVAYPLSFDWAWLYWYFTAFAERGSPFGFSSCYDLKTAIAVMTKSPIELARKSQLPAALMSAKPHTHHAQEDAEEQADLFAKLFDRWIAERNE